MLFLFFVIAILRLLLLLVLLVLLGLLFIDLHLRLVVIIVIIISGLCCMTLIILAVAIATTGSAFLLPADLLAMRDLLRSSEELGTLLLLLSPLFGLLCSDLLLLDLCQSLRILLKPVLTGFHLKINLTWRGCRGEECALFRLVVDDVWLVALNGFLLQLRQESIPALVLQEGILLQLLADHEFLDDVDRMDVIHARKHYSADLLEILEGPHRGYGVTLDHDVAICHQFNRLQGATVGTDQAGTSLCKPLLVSHEVFDFDDVAGHIITKDLQGLLHGHRSRKQLDQVSCLNNHVRIVHLPGRANSHATFNQIQLAVHTYILQRLGHDGPDLSEIGFSVLGEERRERTLLNWWWQWIIRCHRINLPVVDRLVVPGLVLTVSLVLVYGGLRLVGVLVLSGGRVLVLGARGLGLGLTRLGRHFQVSSCVPKVR